MTNLSTTMRFVSEVCLDALCVTPQFFRLDCDGERKNTRDDGKESATCKMHDAKHMSTTAPVASW